jgi:hypothetical protein
MRSKVVPACDGLAFSAVKRWSKNTPVSIMPAVNVKIEVDVPYVMVWSIPQYRLDGEVDVMGLIGGEKQVAWASQKSRTCN